MSIFIGVTGHRNMHPEAIPQIQERVSAVLDEIITRHPDTRITLQSPLAAGADQLVAGIGISKGLDLHVPLPLPLNDYFKDFDDQERKKFTSLLAHASKVWVPYNEDLGRPEGYLMAGSYIAQSSDYVLALWDGLKMNEKPGGTAHIVRLIAEQGRYPFPIQGAKQPLLYHILTPRDQSSRKEDYI